ncbi:MAG: hypothetical protein QXU32_05730 [Nitrososphaerales archaeon]
MLRCFIVRVWLRIPSNNTLHHYFSIDKAYNRKVMKACGLDKLPDRRTFDRRFKIISLDIKQRINTMGMLFVKEGLIDPFIVSIDTLIESKRACMAQIKHEEECCSTLRNRYRCKMGILKKQGMGIWIQTAYSM